MAIPELAYSTRHTCIGLQDRRSAIPSLSLLRHRLLLAGEGGPRCEFLSSPHRDRCTLPRTSSLNYPLPQTHALREARKALMSVSGRCLPPSPAPLPALRTMFPTSPSERSQSPALRKLSHFGRRLLLPLRIEDGHRKYRRVLSFGVSKLALRECVTQYSGVSFQLTPSLT
jgi:hypothetical protein